MRSRRAVESVLDLEQLRLRYYSRCGVVDGGIVEVVVGVVVLVEVVVATNRQTYTLKSLQAVTVIKFDKPFLA